MSAASSPAASLLAWTDSHANRFVSELEALLRIPSVSAIAAHRTDVRSAAEFIRDQLARLAFRTELVETAGHPIVYAESLTVPGAPTALLYGHYDVQPPDPLDQWLTPPFEPAIRDGKIYARGATDDKGQLFTHLKGLEAWMATVGRLPLNIKVIIEGEEEVGSENLDHFLRERRPDLAADIAVISDTSQYGPGQPAITYGLRGIVACEVTVRGPRQDLHSGVFGGAVANPVNQLARMLARLHDGSGRVQVPGFYDDVDELSVDERQSLSALPFDERRFLEETGAPAPWGESGYTTLERRWVRPTCDINGIRGGYQGEGPKTIIPGSATAKITCRLVPRQDPGRISAALEAFLRAECGPAVTMEFTAYHGCPACVVDTSSPYVAAARAAITQAFGVAPVLIREGGSIPVVATFREILRLDTLLLGWGQNTDQLHGPNEHFSLADFQRGIRASALLWGELAAHGR